MPSFGSDRDGSRRVVSIRNAVMPRAPCPGSVIANSTNTSATGPEVIQLFLPLITKVPSACLVALQRIAVASEPDCGSGQRERADLAPFGDGADVMLLLRLGAELGMPLQNSSC